MQLVGGKQRRSYQAICQASVGVGWLAATSYPNLSKTETKPKDLSSSSTPAPEGMVDVKSRKCRTEGCGKRRFFGVAGTKTEEYCAQHAPEGMVDVKSRKCKTEGCY